MERRWGKLRKEMEDIRMRKEFVCLAGDLNKLVGVGQWGVPGNHPDISLGGCLLRDLLATGDWTMVNGLGQDIVTGGPFTRKDPATGKLSCLDIFVVSRELLPFVKSLVIDSERKFTVTRAVKAGSRYKAVPSDHFTCILTLTDLPRVQERRGDKQVVWNLRKEGGWEKYQILSDKYSELLEKVIDSKETDIEEKMVKFDKIHDKIKYQAFGKVTISQKRSEGTINNAEPVAMEENAKKLYLDQENRINDEIEEVRGKNSQE